MNQDIRCDILVCGGGPSGIAAAIGAAKLGANVLLVEKYGFFGGAAASGLVNPFMTPMLNGEHLVKGVFLEIIEKLRERNACKDGELFGQSHIVFDPEILKFVLLEMIEHYNIKFILHTAVFASIMKDDQVKGVLVNGKSGDIKIFAKMIIDATGDGDVAYLSGCKMEKGREKDGLTQPMTLMFRVAGIHQDKMPSMDEINVLFSKAKKEGKIRTPRENFLWFETIRSGEIHVNSTRMPKMDGTSTFDLTKAEIEGRKQAENLSFFLKTSVPGFEDSYISYVAPQVGVRESRRLVGEYVLDEEDVTSGKKFDDPVAKCNYPIDIHSPEGKSTTFKKLGPAVYYEVPYRCLLPKKIENLIVTGRAISTTHEALSSCRIMPVCMALGQAAGAAAALSIKKHIKARQLQYKELREALNEQGADMR